MRGKTSSTLTTAECEEQKKAMMAQFDKERKANERSERRMLYFCLVALSFGAALAGVRIIWPDL